MKITDEKLDKDLKKIINSTDDITLKEMYGTIYNDNMSYEEKQNKLCKLYWEQYTNDISNKEEIINNSLKK